MTDKLRLDLPIILPDIPHAADACVGRLLDDLNGRAGIERAHIHQAQKDTPAQLCVHYDPQALPLARIRELVQAAGARITSRIGHLLLQTDGITHQRRARTVSDSLRLCPGVLEAEASASGQFYVEFDRTLTSESAILATLAAMGVTAPHHLRHTATAPTPACPSAATPACASAANVAPVTAASAHGPGVDNHNAPHDHSHPPADTNNRHTGTANHPDNQRNNHEHCHGHSHHNGGDGDPGDCHTNPLSHDGHRHSCASPNAHNHDSARHAHAHSPSHGHPHTHDRDHPHDHAHTHDHTHAHSDAHAHSHNHDHSGIFGANSEMIFALGCGAALGLGAAIAWLTPAPAWVSFVCYLAAYVLGGYYTLREAIDNIKLRRFEIDSLMLVAAAGAAALGSWAEGALLLFLFSLGHALEHYAMGRAKRAIEALAKLTPETATVRRGGQTLEIPVEQLAIGDAVLVRPNERLPADGFLTQGNTSINQAPVTGESMPVDKRAVADAAAARARPETVDAASRVFAGTINGSGAIEIEVTRRADDSALARVVKMVSEAETRKSPTQRFTDKFERIFVPLVLALAFTLLFAWVVVDEPFRDSFYRAMAVLVAASPCALAIATPSAVLSGIARAARGGVLIKGGAPLEALGSLRAIAFDKTGTLTEGKPRITDLVTAAGASEQELLATAVAVETLSDHPLAAAIVAAGKARSGGAAQADKALAGKVQTGKAQANDATPDTAAASELKSLTGLGVTAMLGGERVWIGKEELFGKNGVEPLSPALAAAIERLQQAGRTTMAVRIGARELGVIGLMDTPRPEARGALQRLRSLGISRMVMISGDNSTVAQAVAREVGIDEALGDLMPEDKVGAIRALSAQGKVAMVGDGVNDAPAMANATVGIAMGAAGSDVALETADIALMADNLAKLPFAVGLSRRTRAIILQNVFISLGVVAVLVPLTILGLGIGPAVAMHEGSTLVVVFNALRLLAYRDRDNASTASLPQTPQ